MQVEPRERNRAANDFTGRSPGASRAALSEEAGRRAWVVDASLVPGEEGHPEPAHRLQARPTRRCCTITPIPAVLARMEE